MGDLRQLLRDNAKAKARMPLNVALPAAGSASEATIYVYDVIVSDPTWGGVVAEEFVTALMEAALVADTIHLRINSPGGDVFAARAMEAAVRGCAKKVVAHVDGYAASAASYLALAADEVEIAQGGFFMVHKAWCLAMGNSEDHAATSSLLAQIDVSLVDTYAKETGLPARKIEAMMAAETWISSKEAVAMGFADRIAEDAPKASTEWNLAAYANAPKLNTTTPETKPEKRNETMDYGQKTHRLQQLGGLMDGMTASAEPWSEEKAKLYNAWEAEATELRSQVGAHQDALDRVAEALKLNNGSVTASGRPPVDKHQLVSAVGSFVRTGSRDGFAAMNAALTEDPASGGAIVPSHLFEEILVRQKAKDPLRQVAHVETISTAIGKVVQPFWNGGLTASWVGEMDSRPVGGMDPIAAIEFPSAAISATTPIGSWLDQDSKIGEFVIANTVDQFSMSEGSAFVSGDGDKKPMGFLSVPQSTAPDETRPLGTLQVVGGLSGGANALTADALVETLYALRPSYRSDASWTMNSRTLSIVRKLRDGSGAYIWQPALMAGQPELLLGRPVVELESMPDAAPGSIPVAVGAWSRGYFIIDRNMLILRDPYTVKGQILFYCEKRVSGNVVDSNSIKLLKLAAL